MARDRWHYTKLSLLLSSALLFFTFSGVCFLLFPFFLSSVLFLFCFVFMLSLELCTTTVDDMSL